MADSLSIRYRPRAFDQVIEQGNIKIILQQQINNGTFQHAYLFCGPSGDGKAQPLDSLVLTVNGYKRMGDVKIGDSIVDGLGKKCYVQGIFPQGEKDVYKITFSDNTSVLCSNEHLWKLIEVNKNNNYAFNPVVLTTDEIRFRMGKHKYREYRIPTPTITAFERKNLPIDPYLLGILIADGSLSGNFGVCLPEYDVRQKVNELLSELGMHLVKVSPKDVNNYDYRIAFIDKVTLNQFSDRRRTLKYKLDKLGLLCKSVDKHIPHEYLFSAVENRWRLLQGLFDGDGYTDKGGNLSFSTSSNQLSEDFAFLVRSLGATDRITESVGKYKNNGKVKECNKCYTHSLKFNRSDLGKWCSSAKHTKRAIERQHDPIRKITTIEYVGKQECQCIYVSSKDHTYITDNLTVTHNTTLARIFANEINKGKGNPIEIDAASHSSVNDVRELSQQAKSKSLDSEYKIFIVDEAHSISGTGWQAFLKLIEEPPAKTIFIFCTTDPQKIPKTILGRVQRFDFQRISTDGIFNRLAVVVEKENMSGANIKYETEALEYISKLADGGMRDALTTLDKVIAYSKDVTMENVVKALGVVDYSVMFELLDSLVYYNTVDCISIVEGAYRKGIDLKQFIKMFTKFVLDVNKYTILKSFKHLEIPETQEYKKLIDGYVNEYESNRVRDIMEIVVKLNSQLKWETSPKAMIESTFILECNKG